MQAITRRSFLELGIGLPALSLSQSGCSGDDPDDGWDRGDLQHLLPTVSHRAFHLKLSFRHPVDDVPRLQVGPSEVVGSRLDVEGRFWAFRGSGLAPATEYSLQLRDAAGKSLCDAWPLRTFPAPDARPSRLRVISYTCAGGPNLPIPPSWFHAFKPAAYRRRLFALMVERKPDLVIANGDHVYLDLSAYERLQQNPIASWVASLLPGIPEAFDPSVPILGTRNERLLESVGDDQIAAAYGVGFRSTPVFFITDDHDYFENDDATSDLVTFPPDAFHRSLRDALQHLYFPEFISESDPGGDIPGWAAAGEVRLSTHFGEIQFGDLFRGLLYDCGGYLSLGEAAGLVPPAVEAWLIDRTKREDTVHLAHFPSHPMGWTAGKWREWYPDFLESTGSVVAAVTQDASGSKFMWQPGWGAQHQRLLHALASQRKRAALMASGDLHALGATCIDRSGDLDLSANPVYSVLSGPVGTGEIGFPSRARGVETRTPAALGVRELHPFEERNGFSVLDFDRDGCRVELLRCPQPYVSPDELQVESARWFRVDPPS